MSGTATWLLAAGAIGLLIASYWLRFWVRREVIYRPLRKRTGRVDATRQADAISDLGTSAVRNLAACTSSDPPKAEESDAQLATDPSTTHRIATLASADTRSPHA